MEADMLNELHSHCEACYKRHCLVKERPPVACPQVSCKNGCGAVYHECKGSEHIMLCFQERVPCINVTNGCPIKILRKSMSAHLVVCPANVIYCTMEWNRWPVYSKERQARVPFSQPNLHAKYGQLDVSLALRDQRLLNEAMKVPRKTRQVLRNRLTQRFPAVPLVSRHSGFEPEAQQSPMSDETSEEDDSDAPWVQSQNPPGLQRSVCGELFQASRKATECLTAALSIVTENKCTSASGGIDNLSELGPMEAKIAHMNNLKAASKKADVHEPIFVNCDTYPTPEAAVNPGYLPAVLKPDLPRELDNMVIADNDELSERAEGKTSDPPTPPAPPTSLMLQHILGLDLNLESITRYQAKPKSMYTFFCAQAFKRNEYAGHFKHVHCDIHSQLNGWFEQRCPLATYGCTFSIRRLFPQQADSTVVYSQLQSSFGIRSETAAQSREVEEYNESRSKQKEPTPEIYTSKDYDSAIQVNGNLNRNESSLSPPRDADTLTGLPAEVLIHMTRFLDGFSLCNLSLTCRTLRDVCCSLLEERGIVIQEWERQMKSGSDRPHWFLAYKRWLFSSAFEPVEKWVIGDHPHISDHLKVCPFNRPNPRTTPWKVCAANHEDPMYYRTIQQMYPEFERPEEEVGGIRIPTGDKDLL